jgi:NH3-dependent NAD+ synthetase
MTSAPTDRRLDAIITWIRQTTDVAGGRGVLVPVSGGSDSALCLWLCAQALPRGRALAAYVGGTSHPLRCQPWFESFAELRILPAPPDSEADPEMLRWATMLHHAKANRCWLAGSRTRTEDTFGTYSLASRLATYQPLAGTWKTEVMELCDLVGVPREITESSRQADPACGRPMEMADIPFAYVDRFLQAKIGHHPPTDLAALDEPQRAYLETVYRRNQFKKHLPLRPQTTDSRR